MRWRACDNTYLTCMDHDGGDQRSRGADLGGGGSCEHCKSKKEKKKKLVVSVDTRWDSGRWSTRVHTGGVDALACGCGIDRKRS